MKKSVLLSTMAALLVCGFIGPVSAESPYSVEVHYTGGDLRDPFLDQAATQTTDDTEGVEKAIKRLKLQGILFSPENPRAIISGSIYQEGSKIGTTGKVLRIEKDGVTLDVRGKEYFIKQTMRKTSDDYDENDATPANKK